MKDDRDYKLDLSPAAGITPPQPSAAQPTKRPFISVHFTCCNVYLRIYRSPTAPPIEAMSPLRPAGELSRRAGGTEARFFRQGKCPTEGEAPPEPTFAFLPRPVPGRSERNWRLPASGPR